MQLSGQAMKETWAETQLTTVTQAPGMREQLNATATTMAGKGAPFLPAYGSLEYPCVSFRGGKGGADHLN